MSAPINGAVPANNLAKLDGTTLKAEINTAAAYNRLRNAHPEIHLNGPAAAYWAHALDVDIHTHPSNYNISPAEAKNLSPVGHSPHGLGIRLNFSGITPAVAAQFGFLEFNSYTYTYKGPYSWDAPDTGPDLSTLTTGEVKLVATYLNGRAPALGRKTSTAAGNGIQGPLYWTLVQSAGAADGLYPQPAYKINGIPGPKTYSLEKHYLGLTTPIVPPKTVTPGFVGPTKILPPAKPTTPTSPAKETAVTETLTPAEQAKAITELQTDTNKLAATLPPDTLAGLFSGHPRGRKRAYAAYAIASLLVSFGPDLVTYGVVAGNHVPALVSWIGLTTSALLKIGAAFGFVAASNAKG